MTIFVSFICNKDAVPDVQPYPRPIMSWSSVLYSKVFQGISDFKLREKDYVLGSASLVAMPDQLLRIIGCTSFLWDFETSNMSYLKHPKRTPEYRLARDHLDFICPMKDYVSRSDFIDKTIYAARSQFSVESTELEAIKPPSNLKFSPTSKLLTKQELEDAMIKVQPIEASIS